MLDLSKYSDELETLQNTKNYVYKYDCYKIEGKNLIYTQSIDREAFDHLRNEYNVTFGYSGDFSLRKIEKSDPGFKYFDCVIEERIDNKNDIYSKVEGIYNKFLDDFIAEFKITKAQEFKDFIEYYHNDCLRMESNVMKIHIQSIYEVLTEETPFMIELFK